jgi:hypothetical protein
MHVRRQERHRHVCRIHVHIPYRRAPRVDRAVPFDIRASDHDVHRVDRSSVRRQRERRTRARPFGGGPVRSLDLAPFMAPLDVEVQADERKRRVSSAWNDQSTAERRTTRPRIEGRTQAHVGPTCGCTGRCRHRARQNVERLAGCGRASSHPCPASSSVDRRAPAYTTRPLSPERRKLTAVFADQFGRWESVIVSCYAQAMGRRR